MGSIRFTVDTSLYVAMTLDGRPNLDDLITDRPALDEII